MTEELRKKHFQHLDDCNGTWHALKDVLDEAIDLSIGSALTDGIDNDDQQLEGRLRAGDEGYDGDVESVS